MADGWEPTPFLFESRDLPILARHDEDEDTDLLVEDTSSGVKARIGVLRIEGALQRRPGFWSRLFDASAKGPYETITAEVNRMRAEGYAGLILLVDSGGGMVHGLADPVRAIIAARADMPVWSLCLGMGASAAYPLLAAAGKERTFATDAASVGSLAARMVLEDSSKLFEELGIKRHALTGGNPQKAVGVAGIPITDAQLAAQDEQVRMAIQESFYPLIADALGVQTADVRRMAGGGITYTATEAQRQGLIAGIMTADEFFEMVTGSIARETAMTTPRAPAAPNPAPAVDPDASATPAAEPEAAAQPEPAEDAPGWFATYEARQLAERTADRAEIAELRTQIEARNATDRTDRVAGFRQRLEAVQAADLVATVESMLAAEIDPEPIVARAEAAGDPVADLRTRATIGEGDAARTVDLTQYGTPGADGVLALSPEAYREVTQLEAELAPAAGDPLAELRILGALPGGAN